MKKRLTILIILITCLILSLGGTAFAFSKVVAFGDSLSDNGPADGYGYGVWTNGKVWVEYLADEMGVPLEDRACGGAKTSGNINGPGYLGLDQEVDLYVSQTPAGTNLSDVLFTVWAGGNDFLSMQPGDDPNVVIVNAISNIHTAIDKLLSIGAKNILVMGLPDLGAIPLNNKNPIASANASALSQAFNQYLTTMLCSYLNFLPDNHFYMVDTYQLLHFIISDPAEFGFTNVTDSGGGTLTDPTIPAGYAFWNDIHPSTAAHQIIAAAACGQVYHHNLTPKMQVLLRDLNVLRTRQPLKYDCELLNTIAAQ